MIRKRLQHISIHVNCNRFLIVQDLIPRILYRNIKLLDLYPFVS